MHRLQDEGNSVLQLRLQFARTMQDVENSLEEMTGKRLFLTVTDNSTSVLSIRKKNGSVAVRMHRMFLNAGDDVIREIAGFIQARKGRTPLIRQFIRDNRESLKKKERKVSPPRLCTQGKIFNLREIFDALNREYFDRGVAASIGWGRSHSRRAVRKRTLGTYCADTSSIRINPILDRKNIPHYFVSFVVYHEMLHSVVKEERKNGRRALHTTEFRNRERLYKDYEKAISWERKKR